MEKRRGHKLPRMGLCLLVLVIMAGCAPAFLRANPQLQEKVKSIHTVAIMPPSIHFYALSAGGSTQLMDEPTGPTKQIVAAAIEKELERHAGLVFKPFPSPSAILETGNDLAAAGVKDELEDTQALFDAVSASVLLHTYKHDPDQTFPEKLKNFDYSLGPDVGRLATLANADALLFISGVDHISTGGRKTLMTLMGVLCTAGLLVNPFEAARCFAAISRSAPAILSVALVDATTGALLWYNVVVQGGLTEPYFTAGLTEQLFEDFPLGKRPTRKESDQNAWPISLGPR